MDFSNIEREEGAPPSYEESVDLPVLEPPKYTPVFKDIEELSNSKKRRSRVVMFEEDSLTGNWKARKVPRVCESPNPNQEEDLRASRVMKVKLEAHERMLGDLLELNDVKREISGIIASASDDLMTFLLELNKASSKMEAMQASSKFSRMLQHSINELDEYLHDNQ